MAAAQDVSFDDTFTCSICVQTFKLPKYLPCLHSFCEACLDNYIQSSIKQRNAPNTRGFKCPACGILVRQEDLSGNPNTWAKQMPLNQLFMSMIDRIAIEKSEKLCDACILDNNKEIAVFWCVICQEAFCAKCEKYHRKFKVSASHNIIDINEGSVKNADRLLAGSTMQCEEHNGKAIEVYCVEHNNSCCTLCATVNHRKCEKVVAIDEVVSGFKNSMQSKTMSDILNSMRTKLADIIRRRKENILKIEGQTTQILQSTIILKDNVTKHLEKLDHTFRSEIDCATKQVLLPLKDEATLLSSYKCTVDNWRMILQTCLSYGSETQCFVDANKISTKMNQIEKEIANLKSNMLTTSLKFKANNYLVELQTGLTTFGKIETDIRCSSIFYLPKVNFKKGNVKLIRTIEVDIGKTGKRAISGIFFRDFIILSDWANEKVIKYDDKGIFLKDLTLKENPSDITRVEEDTVAVNEGHRYIVIIRVTDMEIQQKINLAFGLRYLVHGLQYINNTFVCSNDHQITWINAYTGEIVDTRKTKGDTLFLHASKNQEFTFADGKQISRLSNGQLHFLYENKEMGNPAGIDVDFEGNIYVCSASASNNIYQLTKEGALIRMIPTATLGIEKPWVLRFKDNGNRFLITQLNSGKVLICEIEFF